MCYSVKKKRIRAMSSHNHARAFLPDKKRIVVKVGTSSLLHPVGTVNLRFINELAWQLADLRNRGKQVILVSSGAIGVGFPLLGFSERPASLIDRQASAAVGQGILLNLYERFFHEYGQIVAQMLFTKGDVLNSKRYLHVMGALRALLELGAIPIINENDVVATDEIKIGDNDTLSAVVASISEADLLIILSDIDGLYEEDPRVNPKARLIHQVGSFSRDMLSMAGGAGSKVGTGGMYTKLQAAEICVRSGIDMIIAKSSLPETISRIMDGEEIGTLFCADPVHHQMRKRSLIIGFSVKGKIFVDQGCMEALMHHGSSLLPVGIERIEGSFDEGDTISIYYKEKEIARGITYYDSDDIMRMKGSRTEQLKDRLSYPPPYETVIHRDNLIIMK